MIKNMFELVLGISTKEGSDDGNTYAYVAKYDKSIQYEGNSVIAPFPLKVNVVDLTGNYSMALRRLVEQVKHVNSLQERKKWYVTIIKQYLAEDIEEVNDPVPN